MNPPTSLLEGDVLTSAEYIQAADGGISIVTPGEKGHRGFPGGLGGDNFRLVPTGAHEGMIEIIATADNDQVERVASFGSFFVDGAARQRLEVLYKRFLIFDILPGTLRIEPLKVDRPMIDLQSGNRNEKSKRPDLAVFTDQIEGK